MTPGLSFPFIIEVLSLSGFLVEYVQVSSQLTANLWVGRSTSWMASMRNGSRYEIIWEPQVARLAEASRSGLEREIKKSKVIISVVWVGSSVG